MTQTLDITLLRTLVAIEECGGFGRAAAALYISQPTVSQHVRMLEQRLGHALVEKEGRRSKFTPAGEKLLIEARRILAVHDEALARLDAAGRHDIVLGSTETAADQLLPKLLRHLRTAFPDRQVLFQIERSTQMVVAVEKGTIDLAIVLDTGNSIPGALVGTLPLNWYSAPDWNDITDGVVPLAAYLEPCGMRQRALQELAANGLRANIVAESGTLEGVIAAARAGLCTAVLPSAGRAPEGLIVRHDLPSLGEISVRLTTRRGLDRSIEQVAVDALDDFFERLGPVRRMHAISA